MSTATIKPKTGTAQQWTDSGRILELNEWGVSITEDKKYILKIGDGINKFDDLPAAVSTPYFEEIQANVLEQYNEVMQFKNNITDATAAANIQATKAETAASNAQAAADACNAIAIEQNAMTDETAGVAYRLGVNNGMIFIEEIE